MAKVINTKAKKMLPMKRSPLALPDVELPLEATELSAHLTDYSFLIHGEKKIGKTSLFAQEKGAMFLEWDPEQKALAIFQRQVPDWQHFLAYLKLLEGGKHDFRTVVIDGVDIMYQACFRYMCKKMGIEHPHDENDFGKSWNKIKTEFADAILRLLNLPEMACRFIAHSAWREIKTRSGGKIEKLVPIIPSQAEEILVGEIDVWGAYCYDGNRRVLVIKGDETTGAGHRIDHCFRTPKGEAVEEIPMGKSAREAYANLVSAFQNKQPFPKPVAGAGAPKKKLVLKRA